MNERIRVEWTIEKGTCPSILKLMLLLQSDKHRPHHCFLKLARGVNISMYKSKMTILVILDCQHVLIPVKKLSHLWPALYPVLIFKMCIVYFYLQIVDFLQKQVDFVDLMIKHIGTSAIMDLLLRMLTCIEPQQLRQDVLSVGIISWLCITSDKKLMHFFVRSDTMLWIILTLVDPQIHNNTTVRSFSICGVIVWLIRHLADVCLPN